jgi:murein DD-endopeptidase MepM/ murein hydrolase activator NlpD
VNIIILCNSGRNTIRLNLGRAGLALCGTVLCGVLALSFYSGIRHATGRLDATIASVRSQTEAMWREELGRQQDALHSVRARAEHTLEALAGRLSLLQGHVLRLDALGSRLAAMADLDDMQFGFDTPPGIGGPAPDLSQESVDINELLATLSRIETGLEDKAEKLSAMESMLIDRALQEQTLPEGAPARGAWISSLFGYRTDPLTGRREFHQGIDLAGRPETPITAVAAGIVTWSGPRHGYGNLVEISHGRGYLTRYAHNRKNLVSVGEKVEKGEVIALMGSTGRSTGPHVHFEVVRAGDPVDPRRHLSLP